MRNTIESLAQSFKAYEQMNIAESAKAIAESINAMSKSLRLEQLKQLQQIDFSCMFADIVPNQLPYWTLLKPHTLGFKMS